MHSVCFLKGKGKIMAKKSWYGLTSGRNACKICDYVICVCKPVVGYNPQSKHCVEDESSTSVVLPKTEDRILCVICGMPSIDHSVNDNKHCDNELKLCQEQMLNDGMSLSFSITIVNGKRVKIPRLMSTQRMKKIKEDLDES